MLPPHPDNRGSSDSILIKLSVLSYGIFNALNQEHLTEIKEIQILPNDHNAVNIWIFYVHLVCKFWQKPTNF